MIWLIIAAFVGGVLVTLLVQMLASAGEWSHRGVRQTYRERDWVRTADEPPKPDTKDPPEAA